MKPRLASLFLLLVLFGGAFAGVPLSFSDGHCGMGSGMSMSCCKAGLRQKRRPKLSQAELLCAIECAQSGATLPERVRRLNAPAQSVQQMHPALMQPLTTQLSFPRTAKQSHSPPGSPPKYLRNLALLI